MAIAKREFSPSAYLFSYFLPPLPSLSTFTILEKGVTLNIDLSHPAPILLASNIDMLPELYFPSRSSLPFFL